VELAVELSVKSSVEFEVLAEDNKVLAEDNKDLSPQGNI